MQALWMLAATFLFSVMGVFVKLASSTYTTSEIVTVRGGVGVFFLLGLVYLHGGTFKTSMVKSHMWRGIFGVTSLWLWFYSIAHLPLSLSITLSYMSSIWVAVILFVTSWWKNRGKQVVHLPPSLAAAIVLGFVGVVMLLQPTITPEQVPDSLVALCSGFIAALAYLQVRQMGVAGEPEYRVVFYFSFVSTVMGVVGQLAAFDKFSVSQAAAHQSHHLFQLNGVLLLLGVGLFATIAQIFMTRAYRLGNPLVAANLQYVGIVFTTAFDIWIWNLSLSWISWCGIAVILASGMIASNFNSQSNTADENSTAKAA
ncbi:DMT family transporter [Undibacterium cyanobacteriorum]|uniref:DMT family transporter n=1 Tax=Undibacterium cyanobacteriorum TaxID=3073561 RepID=A0ABY9RFC2_9BURK|nr:DMT family transporter [Undibacterium sp. 20NA77.5]WMW79925.1 DMT family transporter [Undibacterium sp. 20NA77.5]